LKALYEQFKGAKQHKSEARAQKKSLFLKIIVPAGARALLREPGTERATGCSLCEKHAGAHRRLVVNGTRILVMKSFCAGGKALLALVVNPDIIYSHAPFNNVGKSGGAAAPLRHVLRLRAEKESR